MFSPGPSGPTSNASASCAAPSSAVRSRCVRDGTFRVITRARTAPPPVRRAVSRPSDESATSDSRQPDDSPAAQRTARPIAPSE